MTRYKILKDLLWLEAWKIIENEKIFSLSYLKENWWLEEIEEEKTIYNLDVWDWYYYINDLWIIKLISIDSIDSIKNYKQRLEIWNVFLTYQEVLKELYKRKSLATIRKWILGNEIELSKDFNWYTIYWEVNKIVVWRFLNCRNEFWIIFQNEKDAEKCLKECKKEWKILYLK